MQIDTHELLTTEQAARELKMTVQCVRHHARGGRLPTVRLGRCWFYRREDVLAFVPRKRGRPRKDAV